MKVVKSMCTADMIVQRATVKSHAFQGHVERGVRIIENPCILVLFDVQEMMRVEVDPTSAASAWILSRSVCFLNRYQQHEGGATSFERRFGSPCRSPIFLLFAMVECLVPSDRKTWWSSCGCEGSTANVQVNVWVGRAEECDEHLVVNEIGDVVRVRAVRRCVGTVVLTSSSSLRHLHTSKLTTTTWESKGDGLRRMDAQRVALGNKQAVRCDARRYEYRMKYGRNPFVTARRVYHKSESS